MTSPALVMVSSSREWAHNLSSHCAAHGGAEIVQVVLEIDALDVAWDALLVDDTFAYLNPPLVQRLRGEDRVVVGFYDPHLGVAGQERLEREWGMDAALPSDSTGTDIVVAVDRCLLQRRVDKPRAAISSDEKAVEAKSEQGVERSNVLVTTGLGSTELAVGLADVLARESDVLLVDGDTIHPQMAQRLGLHPNSDRCMNLHGAVDAIHRGVSFRTFTGIFGFDVLPGIAHHSDWSVYPASDIVMVAEVLAGEYDVVIVDVNEGLEQLGLFGESEDRFGVSRMLVRRAGEIVVGIGPSPLGVVRGLEWLALAAPLMADARCHVAVNRFRGDAHQSAQLVKEFTRSFRPASFTLVPDDRRVDRAVWMGETVPGGAFRKAVERIADAVREPVSSLEGAAS
ncbi:MAG: hypothetical protein GEU79_09200 [Acidimicrobiia bacterium]|nr:hypothetical protein [Acidimicrobiia bacterium]